MQHLKCQEDRCKANYYGHCVKDIIMLSREAYCHSYESRNSMNREEARYEFEFACEIGLPIEDDMHRVVCNSEDCEHNDARDCLLRQLLIDKKQCGARCANYRKS